MDPPDRVAASNARRWNSLVSLSLHFNLAAVPGFPNLTAGHSTWELLQLGINWDLQGLEAKKSVAAHLGPVWVAEP